jgi:hypothetical protein
MTKPIALSGFSPATRSIHILGRSLLLLWCTAPLATWAQTKSPDTPAPAAVPTLAENLSITPKFGQTQEQLASDRAECQVWAKGQTGFDPSQYGGGVAATDYSVRRQLFGRAMAACLEGHGYTVHFVAPAAPPPPSYGSTPAPPPAVAPAPVVMRPLQPSRPELRYRPFTFQIGGGYSVTTAPTDQLLDNGANVGLGFSWFPTSALPIGLRVDGSYSWFRAKDALLNSGNFNSGHEDFYGGDADLQLNLAQRSSAVQIYLFGGAGWYREQTVLRQISLVNGVVCGWYFCESGYFPAVTAEQRTTSDWHHAWNAGVGIEFPIADRGSFFMEARYLRILPNKDQTKFVPIRVGFRF